MVIFSRLINASFRRSYCRAIALVQLLVMVMLAVPACCYELEPDHERAGVSQLVKANDAASDDCPCCPDDNNDDVDSCSTCSYCSPYTPLTPNVFTDYNPSVVPLTSPEIFSKISDVHIPIFVPPQNFA